MPAIGQVTKQQDGSFKGFLKTQRISVPVDIVPNPNKSQPNQPDYRIYTRQVEIGGGWVRVGKQSRNEYVSVGIAAPEFGPNKLYANLGRAAGQDDDVLAVIWNPKKQA